MFILIRKAGKFLRKDWGNSTEKYNLNTNYMSVWWCSISKLINRTIKYELIEEQRREFWIEKRLNNNPTVAAIYNNDERF